MFDFIHIEQEKKEQLDVIIAEEHLKPQETEAFMQRAFNDGFVTETGTGIAKILPPTNPFLPESGEKKQTVIERLKTYLNKFLGTTEDSYRSHHIIKMYPAREEEDNSNRKVAERSKEEEDTVIRR